LKNETDMAFRRRALTVFEYLELTDGDRLLECGCGRGFYLNMIRELSRCEATGIELDPPVIAVARDKVGSRGVSLLRADITRLPFRDAQFNKILFSEVLEHIPDDRRALEEIRRVLEPGGVVAVTVPNARYPLLWDPLNRVLEDLFDRPIRTGIFSGIWANHERLYTKTQLEKVARDAGFTIEDLRPLTYYCFPFSHNIVYGFGKELLERGLLPKKIAVASDRFTYDENKGSLLNPVNLMRSIFLAIDKLNDRYPSDDRSVVLAMKLRKL
jgi:ubiquinone/menaquinone biosynthesis C-methylase UbiE